jgi:hypothetical protein
MKLRTMAVIALALVAGGAQAQDAGWDSKMGFVFGIGIDGAPLDSYNGKVGLQLNMGPQAALRLGLDLQRESCGDIEEDNGLVNVVFTDVCQLTGPGGFMYNSALGIGLSAEYLMRSSTAAVSPYFGGGVYIDFATLSLKGEDKTDQAGDIPYEYNNKATNFGFGLLGKAGVEWRVNKVIAFFAEYQLDINLISSTKAVLDEKAGATNFEDSTIKSTDIFNLGTGVSNAGLVGLVAFF